MRLDPFRLPQVVTYARRDDHDHVTRATDQRGAVIASTLVMAVPLRVAGDLGDVAAGWRAWADAYRLQMLLIEADGIARTLEESLGAAIKTLPAQDRRKGRVSTTRRPRFLARRRAGDLGLRLVVDGQEIISRE
jgi:hypothetical protein